MTEEASFPSSRGPAAYAFPILFDRGSMKNLGGSCDSRRSSLDRRPPLVRLSLILLITLGVVCGAQTVTQKASALNGSSGLEEAHVNPHIAQIVVKDGDDIRFNQLSTEEGLSQTRVSQIVQDDRGFMWFGTQYGLDRYDGYEFKVFAPDPSQGNSISGAYIYSLFKDRSGMLWIGCGQYLDRLDPITESFTHYRLNPGVNTPVTVVQITQDPTGILWLATDNGLYGLDPATGRVTNHYLHDPRTPLSLSSNSIRSAAEDRKGRFWVADGNGTLERLDRKTGNVTFRFTLASSVREFSFNEDASGLLWIYSSEGPFASFDPNSDELTYYSFYDEHSETTLAVKVIAMFQDKDGGLWLGTMGAGLLELDSAHKIAICHRHLPTQPYSLADDRVIALTQDRVGNIWVGMHASAPNFFSTRRSAFRPLLSSNISPNSLGERLIDFIYRDRKGTLWVATPGTLLGIDSKSGKYRSYKPPRGLTADIVAMTEDRAGTLWVGTIGRGLNRFDPDTGRFTAYLHNPAVPSSLSNDAVDHLFVDRKGTMWVGTWDGLNRFDPATGRFAVFKNASQSQAEPVYGIAEDQSGTLWLGGPSGLRHFDPTTGQFAAYQHKLDDPSSISDDRVINIYIDQSGAVWAATHDGLDRLDRRNGTFTRYFVRDGLPSNRLNCILADDLGHMWISTTKGLSEFDPVAKTFTNFSVADGLPGEDLTGWSACAKGGAGEMYFGGFSGGTAFNPHEIVPSIFVPPIVLTDLHLAGVSVGVGGNSPLKESIAYAQSITLSHSQATFSIQFAALSYSTQSTNRYRYRLESLDSTWHEVGSGDRVANYNLLPPGEYQFRVQGAASSGPWGVPGASLRIVILPPWWETLWFRLLGILLAILLMYFAYSYRMRRLSRQFELRLEERVAERTRIARELHDTLLQGFQGLIFRLQAVNDLLPEGKAKNQLERSLQRADQAIGEGRSAVYDLRASATAANDLPQVVRALGEELAAETSATFRLIVEGAERDLHPIVRDEIYRITREGLRNAFHHARASQIETEMTFERRLFRIRIRDDGNGIPSEILEGGRPGHYGLSGMQERARKLGGTLEIWSGERTGTEIQLSVAGSLAYGTSAGPSIFRPFRRKTG